MIFHNTKLINLGETEVSLFLFVLLVVSFSSPRDADNLSLRFENVCISRRGLLFYCTSFWNLQVTLSIFSFLTTTTKIPLKPFIPQNIFVLIYTTLLLYTKRKLLTNKISKNTNYIIHNKLIINHLQIHHLLPHKR